MNSLIKLLLVSVTLCPVIYLSADVKNEKKTDLTNFYEQAFGTKRTLPSQLAVNLQLDNKDITKINVYSEHHKKITHIEAAPLLLTLKRILKPKYFKPLLTSLDHQTRISLSYLKKADITTQFDQTDLSIKIKIPIKMRLPIDLTLGQKRKKRYYPAKNELAQAAIVSAYTNFDAKLDYDDTSSQSKQRLQTLSVLNIKGTVLESGHTWRNDRTQQWTRDSTRVIIDDPSSLHRYTLGDINTEYRNYQQGVPLAGLKVEKKSALNPYLKKESNNDTTFSLSHDSTVNIYINGFLKDKKELSAGEYRLTDLNLSAGVNKIRLQITDKEGKTSEQLYSLLADQRLLTPGTSSYALEVGVPSYRSEDNYQYDKSAMLVSGYYKKGLSNQLTTEVSFISDGKNLQIGANALIPTPIGHINGRISQLNTISNQQGYAAGVKYQYNPPAHKKEAVQFSASGDYFDKEFAALSYSLENSQLHAPNNQGIKSQVSANISKKLKKDLGANLNIQRETSYKNSEIQYSANIGLTKSFKKGGSVSVQLRYQNNQQKDTSVNFRLNIPLAESNKKERHKVVTTSYDSIDQRLINSFFINPKSNSGKDSLAGSVSTYSKEGSHSLNANVSYRGDIAEIGFSQNVMKIEGSNEQYRARSNARVKTAISFADGQFAASKTITDSFAIITGPKNQDKDIAVIRGNGNFSRSQGNDLPDHYHGLIQKNASPAVINIPSYHYSTLNADSTSLPLGSDLDSTEFTLKSSYKRGYLLKAGGEPGVIVDATLLDLSGNPLALKGGQLISLEIKKKPITFFTNRTGRIRLMSVPPGIYKLDLFDNKKETRQLLNIPNKIGKTHKIGEIKISMKK